jgi:hypothetical protein
MFTNNPAFKKLCYLILALAFAVFITSMQKESHVKDEVNQLRYEYIVSNSSDERKEKAKQLIGKIDSLPKHLVTPDMEDLVSNLKSNLQ